MIRVADYIAKVLLNHGVTDAFMLTGYGAMYLNDAIASSGIRHYATRNEATAPMMAEAYARVTNKIGVVCVTAGPGSTNAIPGLAEAYVDSGAVLILSGQVERSHTVRQSGLPALRTFGTAEIDIIPIVSPLTKFAAEVDDPCQIRYLLEKALYVAQENRPGPVWLSIPIDVQQAMIDEEVLEPYIPPLPPTLDNYLVPQIIDALCGARRPLLIGGHGIRQAGVVNEFLSLIDIARVPVILSRLGQDIVTHSHPLVLGHGGVKGQHYCKDIMKQADVVVVLGCRLAVQFVGMQLDHFGKDAKLIVVDVDDNELNKPGVPIWLKVHADLSLFIPLLIRGLQCRKEQMPDFTAWLNTCDQAKLAKPLSIRTGNPIDLYYFMKCLNDVSGEKHIITTDAGSNYYVGGQVFTFDRGQREITSGAFAAMGLSIPLAIGCAVSSPQSQILAITGDGSLELNIQELKTISHYRFNIKLFVINNGGYVSMKKWQDTYFDGRRIDDEKQTGAGTLTLSKVANAFDLSYKRIDDWMLINEQLLDILKDDEPVFVEVVTDHCQKIQDA